VPTYSLDDDDYRQRVHQNGRVADQNFGPTESLFRRYPKQYLVDGKPVPLTMQFAEHTGLSVNRGKYSEPRDVVEPDCCDGQARPDCVVLELRTAEVPQEIRTSDGTNRRYHFPMKHVPRERCYAHSEIWCNQQGDIELPYEAPPKHVKEKFRAEIAARFADRVPMECRVVDPPPNQKP
jgi:hypothetical protein